jgi:hypothetical protein
MDCQQAWRRKSLLAWLSSLSSSTSSSSFSSYPINDDDGRDLLLPPLSPHHLSIDSELVLCSSRTTLLQNDEEGKRRLHLLHVIETALSLLDTYDDDYHHDVILDDTLVMADHGLESNDGICPKRIIMKNAMVPILVKK